MQRLSSGKATPRHLDLDDACMVRDGDRTYCIYPLDRFLTVLGKKWTLLLLAVLGNEGVRRFNELRDDLRFVSARTLTDRLRELEGLGLVDRTAHAEVPPRVEYRLTGAGRGLRRRLLPLLEWAAALEARGGRG